MHTSTTRDWSATDLANTTCRSNQNRPTGNRSQLLGQLLSRTTGRHTIDQIFGHTSRSQPTSRGMRQIINQIIGRQPTSQITDHTHRPGHAQIADQEPSDRLTQWPNKKPATRQSWHQLAKHRRVSPITQRTQG